MDKKNYLSPQQQWIWQYIADKETVSSELLKDIFPELDEDKRNKILSSLSSKGFLVRIKNGLYYNPEIIGDLHKIALLYHEGYIGLSSALRHYNLIEYEDFTISVLTRDYRDEISLKGTQYILKFLPLGRLFTGFVNENDLYISTKEKTIFDCLLKPRLVGYPNITKAIFDAKLDWDKFIEFFKLSDNNALFQRTGYILEMLKKKTKMRIPRSVFELLQEKVKNPVKLQPGEMKSVYDKKWKVQDNVGENNMLSWWY